jgi:hypothetical protein
MQQQQDELPALQESRLQLALQAIKCDATLSQRRAARIYRIPRSTLSTRSAGTTFIHDCTPESTKLLKTEEEVIVQHILDLDARGFPPQLAAVADMANSLRAERHLGHVGINWASTFGRHRPEVKVKFNRKYDYKRALCKDPQVIRDWFRLVENTKAKYGILDVDTYNFDEAGFLMGMISTGAVFTGSERRGQPKSV